MFRLGSSFFSDLPLGCRYSAFIHGFFNWNQSFGWKNRGEFSLDGFSIADDLFGGLFMVKRVLSVSRTGLRDWLVQRISAIYMAFFTLFFSIYFFSNSPWSFEQWSQCFANPWVRVATLIYIFLMLWHAWIGLWTVVTDYVQCKKIRAFIYFSALFILGGSFLYACLLLLPMTI